MKLPRLLFPVAAIQAAEDILRSLGKLDGHVPRASALFVICSWTMAREKKADFVEANEIDHRDLANLISKGLWIYQALQNKDAPLRRALAHSLQFPGLSAPMMASLGVAADACEAAIEAALEGVQKIAVSAYRVQQQLPRGGGGRGRGRPPKASRVLAVQALAQIYHYLTGREATRRVRGKDHAERGKEYGPFWDFVQVMWTVAYGKRTGLSVAYRQWADAKQKIRKPTDWNPIHEELKDHPLAGKFARNPKVFRPFDRSWLGRLAHSHPEWGIVVPIK